MMQPAAFFSEPLVDLGTRNVALAQIFAPQGAAPSSVMGVGDLEAYAAEYHRNYFDTGYWDLVLGRALDRIEAVKPARILDIGSGSGNSVLPIANRFREASIVATDINAALLAILRDFLRKRADFERFALVAVDATIARYREGCVDLAIGAAILHHVMEPERVLETVLHALSPGGWALFFEPFEAGNALLTLTYERILSSASAAERETAAMQLLRRMVEDYRRRARPRSDPIFRSLDDKWMFTSTYFDRVRADQGWGELVIYPLHDHRDGLRRQAAVHLRLGSGLAPEALPDWAWTVLDEADAALSDDLRGELPQEAAILLRKPRKRLLSRLMAS
jgi:ubiquinone/menaquinone biosynthesis C-methylase UbiE